MVLDCETGVAFASEQMRFALETNSLCDAPPQPAAIAVAPNAAPNATLDSVLI